LRLVLITVIGLLSISRRAGIIYRLPLLALQNFLWPMLHDHSIGCLLLSRLRAQCREAPWRLRMIAFHASFTAAVRMVHRIHRHAAHGRPAPMPARSPRFSVSHVLMVQIPKLAHGSHAIHGEFSRLA